MDYRLPSIRLNYHSFSLICKYPFQIIPYLYFYMARQSTIKQIPAPALKGLFDRIYKFLSHRVVYHSLFWLCYIIIIVLYKGWEDGYSFVFTNEVIKSFFYGVAVYFNIYYLIPNYLSQTRFVTYSALLILLVLIVTPLSTISLYFRFIQQPELQQEVIQEQPAMFIMTFLILGVSTILKIITDWIRHQTVKRELERQTMRSELRFLKSQINPHFLFNTLNNLYALTLKKSDKAPEIVLKLSEMMRYMLYECNERRVPLQKEVNYIRNYLDLERLRQGKNAQIEFILEGDVSNQKIAPLMFIPFLENSFKHGLNQVAEGFVKIHIAVKEHKLNMDIENSKPSLPKMNHRSGGIGLQNVQRRLDLLYPEQYELSIDNQPETYIVNLKIDLDV